MSGTFASRSFVGTSSTVRRLSTHLHEPRSGTYRKFSMPTSAHGAQMTYLIFMDKYSSVMEFFPKGWLEHAGIGQFAFKWMAGYTGMRHRGQWKDKEGEDCPYNDNANCIAFYKNGKIGHDEAYFATWMAEVLREVKASKSSNKQEIQQSECPCS